MSGFDSLSDRFAHVTILHDKEVFLYVLSGKLWNERVAVRNITSPSDPSFHSNNNNNITTQSHFLVSPR